MDVKDFSAIDDSAATTPDEQVGNRNVESGAQRQESLQRGTGVAARRRQLRLHDEAVQVVVERQLFETALQHFRDLAARETIPKAGPPPTKKEHLPVSMADGDEILAKLVPAKESFKIAYDAYLTESRKTEDAMLKRRRLIEGHDGLFVRVVRIFEDNYRLVGLDQEAERIRASRKRPGLLAQDDDQDDGSDDDVVTSPDGTPPQP
jgi:hypothetical protein